MFATGDGVKAVRPYVEIKRTTCGVWAIIPTHQIHDVLMGEVQKASGHATKKQIVEEALRLITAVAT